MQLHAASCSRPLRGGVTQMPRGSSVITSTTASEGATLSIVPGKVPGQVNVGGISQYPAMTSIMITWAGPVAISLATGWFGYAFGVRQERDRERRGRQFAAAQELATSLRELQRLVRRLGREDLPSDEVTAAFMTWAQTCDNHTHRLPRGFRHIGRSVRDATGTVFGGVSLVHIRPDTKQLDLAEPHAMWQDFADDYLDYLARSLLEWGDSSRVSAKGVMTYGEWLVRTGRREPHGSNPPRTADSNPAA